MKFFRHCLWIIAALAFAGWHWLQPHSRAHGYTRPAIEQGQAIEGRCVGVTDGDTIKVLSAGNELIPGAAGVHRYTREGAGVRPKSQAGHA